MKRKLNYTYLTTNERQTVIYTGMTRNDGLGKTTTIKIENNQ